jgi:hypothetical protein
MKKPNKKIKVEPTNPTQTTTFKFFFSILGPNKKYIDIQSKYLDSMISYTCKTIKNASNDDMENLLHGNEFEFIENFEFEYQRNKTSSDKSKNGTNIIYGIKMITFDVKSSNETERNLKSRFANAQYNSIMYGLISSSEDDLIPVTRLFQRIADGIAD